MQSIKPMVMEQPGFAVQQYDFTIVLSNAITAILSVNQRPGMFRPLKTQDLENWRLLATQAAAAPHEVDIARMLEQAMATGRLQDPTQYLETFKELLVLLMADMQKVTSVGDCLAKMLMESGIWGTEYVTSPSLGYPRRYYRLRTKMPDYGFPFGLPSFAYDAALTCTETVTGGSGGTARNPGGEDPFQRAIANLCGCFDLPAYSDALIKERSKLKLGRDYKDVFFGSVAAVNEQLRFLVSAGLLYRAQVVALALRLTDEEFDKHADIAINTQPRERSVCEAAVKMRAALKAMIPCHPLLESTANMLKGNRILTAWGERPLLLRHTDREDIKLQPELERCNYGRSTMGQLFTAYALADYYRLRALAESESSSGQALPAALIADVAPDLPNEIRNKPIMTTMGGADVQGLSRSTVGSLLEQLTRYEKYVSLWPDIAAMLGWSGATTGNVGTIEAIGGDFVLTNGEYYSSSPVGVLAGMRPSLSMGSAKVTGLPRRIDSRFNTGVRVDDMTQEERDAAEGHTVVTPTQIVWSVVTAQGWASAMSGEFAYMRYFIPAGMSMGEENAERRWTGVESEADDPIAQIVRALYMRRSPNGFVRQMYGDPEWPSTLETNEGWFQRTSWDAWSWSAADPTGMQAQFLSHMGPSNVDRTHQFYLYKEKWNYRIPVQMARPDSYDWYDERGNYMLTSKYEGFIIFDDTVNLPESTAAVDRLMELLRVTAPTVADVRDAEEAQPPVEA
jgi:hypothetical protein